MPSSKSAEIPATPRRHPFALGCPLAAAALMPRLGAAPRPRAWAAHAEDETVVVASGLVVPPPHVRAVLAEAVNQDRP